MSKKTMMEMHYGIKNPRDLLGKFIFDAGKISERPHKYDLFNFVLTSAALSEWIGKFYEESISSDLTDFMLGKPEKCPFIEADVWINDKSCVPNPAQGVRRHICNAIQICRNVANANKHFGWRPCIKSISEEPMINDWYAFFYAPRGVGLFVNYEGEYYSVIQIKEILVQFYPRLIEYLESSQEEGQNAP